MPKFVYTAIDTQGRTRTGSMEAADREAANARITAQGMRPTSVQEEGVRAAPTRKGAAATAVKAVRRIPRAGATLALFARQLAQLLQAGLPLLRSLETLTRQERPGPFRDILVGLAEHVRSGNSFSEGLARHPRIFDHLFIHMVRAGEASGKLDVVLERLATFLEKSQRVRSRVRRAMTYPAIVVTVAVLIVALLMVYVVPRFQMIFMEVLRGQPMPALTQFVINISEGVKQHFWLLLGLAVVLLFAVPALFRTHGGRRFWDAVLLRLPKFGTLVSMVAIARFSRTFGTLLASGVPILEALSITREVVGNVHIRDALTTVHDRVRDGDSLAAPMERTKMFPAMVTSMIAVGEESGALAPMLERIADSYEEEVDNAVGGLLSIIEPVMVVFLAVVVGTIVVALFLPIVSIIQNLSA